MLLRFRRHKPTVEELAAQAVADTDNMTWYQKRRFYSALGGVDTGTFLRAYDRAEKNSR